MDHKLIECAARLCGWKPEEWDGEDNEQCWAAVWPKKYGHRTGAPPFLTDAGLLALEDALGDHAWAWDKIRDDTGALCYRWTLRMGNRKVKHQFLHPDRAAAACMAAREELKYE